MMRVNSTLCPYFKRKAVSNIVFCVKIAVEFFFTSPFTDQEIFVSSFDGF